MPSTDDPAGRKLSRRRFLRFAGGLAVAGAVGAAVGAPPASADEAAGAPAGTPPAPNGFSIFWITDTQFLSEENPALYRMMNNWIVDNWGAYNGKLVIHTGDMVQTGNVQYQWENASEAMSIFTESGIPYTWCAGNHDDWVEGDESSGWAGSEWGSPSFDPGLVSRFVNRLGYAHWVDDFHSGMDTALAFSANGLNILVISLEWNADPTVLQWAEGILDDPAYATYSVIVAPHAYIDAFGDDDDARWGATLANFVSGLVQMLDSHPNVFLTLNGHFASDSGYNTPSIATKGRNELMFDRQDCCDYRNDPWGRGVDNTDDSTADEDKVGGATVTILNFDTDNGKIHVSTFDIYTGAWRVDPPNQYTVDMFLYPPPGPETIPMLNAPPASSPKPGGPGRAS